MEIIEVVFIKNFMAPRVNLGAGEFMTYMPFKAGQKIKGYIWQGSGSIKAQAPKAFITADNKYAIALNAVNNPLAPKQKTLADAPVATSGSGSTSKTINDPADPGYYLPANLAEKLQAIKSTDIIGNIVTTSRASTNGMLVGAISGVAAAVIWKKPILWCMLGGAVAGGYIAYKIKKTGMDEAFKNKDVITADQPK